MALAFTLQAEISTTKRKGCIFNRKYYLCNIDMHSSLSCERISEHHNVLIYEYIVCHNRGF